uniref:nuclear envelope phosphatase-regulatory subunit 1 isoform X2 n=1 Tax=Myxine glutinosa TaxID=7769 RepID=UPI00358E97A2
MNSLEQAEDLKAFERRLTEIISGIQPATGRWRMVLIVVSVCTATGAWTWITDPETQQVAFFVSLWNHTFFTVSCIVLIGLFLAGIHKRVVAPSMYPFSVKNTASMQDIQRASNASCCICLPVCGIHAFLHYRRALQNSLGRIQHVLR